MIESEPVARHTSFLDCSPERNQGMKAIMTELEPVILQEGERT